MPHTLVTGANSFVASHIINELIASGHTVTGCVRRPTAGDAILNTHPEWQEKLSIAIVEDYTQQDVLDKIFKARQYDHVIHVAIPWTSSPTADFGTAWLQPSVNGILALLRSIAVTGSILAATTGSRAELLNIIFTNAFGTPLTSATARASANIMLAYASSTKEAERARCGPQVYSLSDGTFAEVPGTHGVLFPSYVDVRNLATAHVRALTEPRVRGRRALVGGMALLATAVVEAMGRLAGREGAEGR
ncbi:NAD(P)-binding protein [Mytilinidion resinicola]|uniref:NAD(P)-binding protein n=1 Tax=Mytilinidion resinicola TaxID=574789 RepID=A0A6A6YDM2_9PEZI|nr:NAD(P)-binding protein [Mytilinidion resinicola]KAF2806094.1 NAD(P)-binding protein [Mytilinidion resinicola]